MADVLLDITVFNDLKAGDPSARKVVEGILDGEIKAAASPLTVCELWRSSGIDRRTEIGFLSVLRFVEEVAPALEDARTAGLWLAGIEIDGRRDASCVAIAAATAKRLGIPICTRDAEAFADFEVEVTPY
jgi:predicted nucleic acid-binding protein